MRVVLLVLASAATTLLLAASLPTASNTVTKPNQKQPGVEQKTWPPETLSGKIMMVDPNQKLVVVETADGVPFDLVVTRRTRILSGNQALSLGDLRQDVNKGVSIRFTPEGRGDVAVSIQING